ncbi:Cas9 inhibitor AcrIIA9 family protein [Vagococcus xieshaowenii]|nr:Cas9 inhibitor AcrIIA9 family protein [Vagococcus xieshaowenii]
MTEKKGITNIKELIDRLRYFSPTQLISVFDLDRGYAPIILTKEEQTIIVSPSEKDKLSTVARLVLILQRVDEEITLAIKDDEGELSDLYIGLEGMEQEGKYMKWLVLCDKKNYEKYYMEKPTKPIEKPIEESIPYNEQQVVEKALAKMLKEMLEKHSNEEDRIHNWLCEQTHDEELMKGIIKKDRTIKGALQYAKQKAKSFAENGCACIEEGTVFSWVKEYFLLVKLDTKKSKSKPKPKPKKKVTEKTNKEQTEEIKEVEVQDEQISLF